MKNAKPVTSIAPSPIGGRPRRGSVFWVQPKERPGYWAAKVTLPDGRRPRVRFDKPEHAGLSEARAEELAAYLTENPAELAAYLEGETARRPIAGESFTRWTERWIGSRKQKGLATWYDDEGRLRKYVTPLLDADGEKPMAAITKRDLELLVQDLDRKVRQGEPSWKTATNVWGLVSKAFDDATNAKQLDLRILESNPAIGVRGPDRGTKKSKVYLFPSEFQKLVSCADVPGRWRRLYTLAVYFYARAAEVRGLRWEDIDLEHGTVFIHQTMDDNGNVSSTKGEESRRFRIEAELLPLLKTMHKESGGKGSVFGAMPKEKHLAPMLRRDLAKAGVTRAELFANDETRKQMTFHDLRSTGITWMAIRGDAPLAIKQRAGHKQFSTTEIYIREAEAVRDGFGRAFARLPRGIVQVSSERVMRNGHVYEMIDKS